MIQVTMETSAALEPGEIYDHVRRSAEKAASSRAGGEPVELCSAFVVKHGDRFRWKVFFNMKKVLTESRE